MIQTVFQTQSWIILETRPAGLVLINSAHYKLVSYKSIKKSNINFKKELKMTEILKNARI